MWAHRNEPGFPLRFVAPLRIPSMCHSLTAAAVSNAAAVSIAAAAVLITAAATLDLSHQGRHRSRYFFSFLSIVSDHAT